MNQYIFEENGLIVPEPGSFDVGSLETYANSLINNGIDLYRLKGTIQDPVFHAEGDVWVHTELVCKELVNLEEYKKASTIERGVLFYAALLHDIAKPLCTKIDDDGKITSKGHSKKGEIDVRMAFWKGLSPRTGSAKDWFIIREAIATLIEKHQVPFFAFTQEDPEKLAIQLSWSTSVAENGLFNLRLLTTLAKADMLGRHYHAKQSCIEDIDLFIELVKDLNCFENPYKFKDLETKTLYLQERAIIDPRYSYAHLRCNTDKKRSKVYVLCGIPASGKSSWVESFKKKLKTDIPVLSFDTAREDMKIKNGSKDEGVAIHWVIDKAKDYLRNGVEFIWDATHLSIQMRSKTLDLIHNYEGISHLVYCETQYETVLSRNSKRDTTLTNKKIEEMLYKWEPPKEKESYFLELYFN